MTYGVSDILLNDWSQLKADQAAILLIWRDKLTAAIKADKSNVVGMYKSMIVQFLCKKKNFFKKLTNAQILDIADDLNFLHATWYIFHITYLKTKHGTIFRPQERLFSFTFWQLIMADIQYSKFLILNYNEAKGQEEVLNKLVACIYQPKPGHFTDETIDVYAESLPKGLTFELKYLILHTYSNIRKYIVEERCPTLFNYSPSSRAKRGDLSDSKEILASPAGGASAEPRNDAPQYTGDMWQQILFDASESPTFSGLDRAKNARMYDVLDYLEKKAIENKNRRKK